MQKWTPSIGALPRWGIYLIIIFLSIIFFCPQKTKAAANSLSTGVVLSEVLSNGHGAYEQGLEFIELLNTTNHKVDISDLKLTITDPDRGESVTQNLIDFVGFNDISKTNYFMEIPSGGYALIVDPRYEGQYNNQIKQYSGYNLIMVTVDANYLGFGSLPNDRATVTISDETSSVSFSWEEDPGDGVSFEYDPAFNSWAPSGNFYGASPGYDNQDPPIAKIYSKDYFGQAPHIVNFTSESYDPEKTQITYLWNFDDGSTSTQENPSHTFSKEGQYEVILYVWDALGLQGSDVLEVNILPSNLFISEIYPNPKGPDDGFEFIEIYNGGDKTVDLSDWQIRDSAGNGIILKNEKIKPKSFRVFSGNFYFNNSGDDSANLYYIGGKLLVDSVKYKDAKSGQSYAEFAGKFAWTSVPTPGKKNIYKAIIASSYSKNYSTAYKNVSVSYSSASSSYKPSQVKGIKVVATDDSVYPIGQDFRASTKQLPGKINSIFMLMLILIALILILSSFYLKIVWQEKRARSPYYRR